MFTATANLILPSTVTGSWPRPRWFDVSMWGRSLDTCMLDVRFREKFQDALAVVISEQERAGLDILTHGDFHVDEDMAGRAWHHYPLQRWAGLEGDYLQSEATISPWLRYPPGTLLNEIYTGWRWPHVVGKIEHRDLHYPKLWRLAQGRTRKPIKFGTCCSQVMGLFLDIHTDHYRAGGPTQTGASAQAAASSCKPANSAAQQGSATGGPSRASKSGDPGDQFDARRGVYWDMAVAMNKELLALRDAGCRCIQIEEPTLHFMANTYGPAGDRVKFMIECYNREVQGLDDVEIWIHTCWGNPNMQRVMEDTSYAASLELYMEQCRGDVWTIETRDRDFRDIELFDRYKGNFPKKVCIGAVSHRTLQADRPEDAAAAIRRALRHVPPEKLIVSSDCGFGRQGCNREIAFYKATAIAQGCNIVRKELGLEAAYVPAADAKLQIDIVPKASRQ